MLYLLVTGDWLKGLTLGIYMAVLVGSVDNVVRPTSLTGCFTQRTVTEHGRTISKEYKIKRPLKEALQE